MSLAVRLLIASGYIAQTTEFLRRCPILEGAGWKVCSYGVKESVKIYGIEDDSGDKTYWREAGSGSRMKGGSYNI
jgi:hypothetical protein